MRSVQNTILKIVHLLLLLNQQYCLAILQKSINSDADIDALIIQAQRFYMKNILHKL